MSADSWLKLHTSLLTSQRWVSLPSNEHRHAYVTLLVLAKKHLLSAPLSYIAGMMHMSEERWLSIREDLVKAGLIGLDGTVTGFEESQLSAAAARKRRQRERDQERDMARDMSRKLSREKQMQMQKQKDTPLVSPQPAKPGCPVKKIVEIFNEEIRPVRPYGTAPVAKAIERLIRARWGEGMREEDFRKVCRNMADQWSGDDKMAPYLRPHTLFTGKMESYLNAVPGGTGDQAWKQELKLEFGGSE